jgi:hypothetical protein
MTYTVMFKPTNSDFRILQKTQLRFGAQRPVQASRFNHITL